ncbi:MAG: DUF4302 domain-containing protein [Prevotella sp.]|jgi:hypothetical protein|nr:DUF4302 domain-containing protein [Prevotella sp.]
MKKLGYYILFFTGFLLMQSCLHEENDVFDTPAAQRLNEAQKIYEKILTDAPNGWVLEYIAGDTDANRRGAFNYLLSFKDGQVTAAVDMLALADIAPNQANPYTKITSQYTFSQDMGVIVSFDTYNLYLHYYHDQHGSYTTYKGDFEFTIMEATEDLVVLRGKKYGNIMEMHRLPANITWDKYLEDVDNIISLTEVYGSFKLKSGNSVLADCSKSSNNRYDFTVAANSSASNAIYTQEGIKFIDAIEIAGVKVQNFKWNETSRIYNCTDKGFENLTLEPYAEPSYLFYYEFPGTYTLTYKTPTDITVTKTVTIEEKVKNRTFVLKGATDFDIELGYDNATGTVSIKTQNVGTSGNDVITLCPWDQKAGYLSTSTTVGMVSVLNLVSKENGIIQFSLHKDNGVWGSYVVNGFLLRIYNTAGTFIAYYMASDTGRHRFYDLELTKQ